MSDIGKIIERREQWVEQWQSRVPELLIADLRALISTAKASQRALQVLKAAQRFECLPFDGDGIQREECEHGDCVDATIVEQLLDIFGEGQQ